MPCGLRESSFPRGEPYELKYRTLVRMAFSVLGSIITPRFPAGRAVKGLLQPQDATSRHRTFAPHSCGSRLYLHPALFRERARGQRLIAAIDLSCDKVRYLTVLFRERTDQSLRGQTLYFARESTSHGIVPISIVHEMVGVHRYKLVLFAALFAQHTPNVEVPNLPVAVDARGRSACYPRGSFYPLSPDPSTRGPRIT